MNSKSNKATKVFNNRIHTIVFLFSFISVILSVNEMDNILNTINHTQFIYIFGAIGLITALITIIILRKTQPIIFQDTKLKNSFYILIVIGLSCLIPSLTSKINQNLASKNKICEEYKIVNKEKSSSSKGIRRYYIIVILDNKEQRFTVEKSIWQGVQQNQGVNICLNSGFIGYQFATDIGRQK